MLTDRVVECFHYDFSVFRITFPKSKKERVKKINTLRYYFKDVKLNTNTINNPGVKVSLPDTAVPFADRSGAKNTNQGY